MSTCDKPPKGWICSRILGHEGPCAATREAKLPPFYDPLKPAIVSYMLCAECDQPSGEDYLCPSCRGTMDANTALLVGNVYGALVAVPEGTWTCRTSVEIVRNGTTYTNQIKVIRPSGTYLITVTKE